MVEKDAKGYFVDVTKQKPGKYKVVFEGDCQYGGKTYQFPIGRLFTVAGPAEPGITNLAANYRWKNNNPQNGLILFTHLKGKLLNYQVGYTVDLIVNGVTIPSIAVGADGTFDLSQLDAYEIPFAGKDLPVMVVYHDAQSNKNWIEATLPLSVLTGTVEMAQSKITVYPNPASDQLFIKTNEAVASLELSTLSGELVRYMHGGKQTSIRVPLNGLPVGIYLLRVHTGNKISTFKVVKK